MGSVIELTPQNAWKFFQDNKKRLEKEMVCIAEDGDVEVYLTDRSGVPCTSVYKNHIFEYEEGSVSERDTEETVGRIYKKYIGGFAEISEATITEDPPFRKNDDGSLVSSLSKTEQNDRIYEREDQILMAFVDFLDVLTETDATETVLLDRKGPEIEEMIDRIVRYLAVDKKISIRRPMILVEDESKDEVYTEYPYEEYSFDD